jgi:hypothetical protein
MNSEDEDLMEKWFEIKNISSGTQKSYKIALKYFVELTNKKPSELIDKAKEEEQHIIPRNRTIYKYLPKFKDYLLTKKLSNSTVKLYFYAVCSFYKAFDLSVINNTKLFTDDVISKSFDDYVTCEEICQMITVSPPRERALIHLAALSGISQQEIRNLTINQLLSACSIIGIDLEDVDDLFLFEDDVLSEVLTMDLTSSENTVKHHIFIPPEVGREIIAYLKDRCYGANRKIRIKNNDDTIFVNIYGNKLSGDSVVKNLRNLGEKLGFNVEKNAYCYWRFKSLRKYFVSTIINKIGTQILAYYIAGLRLDESDRTYWNEHPELLKKHYLEFLPFLSLDRPI